MSYRFFVISLVFFLFTRLLPAQNPYIHHYTTFDGLPCNIIYGVFQDSQKFIWFATDAGAVRYDGSTFTTFTKKDGLNSNKITKIKEDSFGRVWIINYEGSLNFYLHNKIYNASNAAFLDSLKPGETFHDFFQDDDKSICFHNPMYEVYRLDSNNHVRKNEKLSEYMIENLVNQDGEKATGPYPADYCSSFPDFILANLYQIRKTASGEYLFWTKQGMFKVKELFIDPVMLHYNYRPYLRASCSRDGYFYILLSSQFIKKFKDELSSELIMLPSPISFWYTMSRPNALLVDRKGYFWVGTFDNGLFCYEEDSIIQHHSADNRVPLIKSGKTLQHMDISQVNGIIEDHEGNIWVSSSEEGVYKISPYINTHRHSANTLFENKGIKEMAAGLWNGIWLLNGNIIYFLMANKLYTLDFKVDNISFNSVHHLKNNKLILGQKYSFFYILHDMKPDPVKKTVNFRSADTSILYMSGITINEKEDKINCFNYFNFDIIDPDTLFKPYASGYWQKDFNVGSRVTNTYYNTEDELIANAKKNYMQVGDTFRYVPELARFDKRIITQHINLNSETELFNIDNESIFIYHDHNFYDLTEAFATPSSLNINSIAYNAPVMFLANAGNIYYCDNPLDIIKNRPVNLELVDINFKNIHKILVINDSLYIASDDGLTVIPESAIKEIIPYTPLPYIRSVLVNDAPYDFTGNQLNLKGRNNLKFMFGSISYSSTPVIYSYILEGADVNWSSGTGNIVAYQNLPFGKYIFRLKVSKPNMEWSEPIQLSVIIRPRFWQHPLFFVFISLLFLGLVILYLFRRVNTRLKQRETDHQLILLEQKALQSMMNPHFIFNTLGSIQNYLLQNKPGEAGIYLSQFARLIRLNIGSLNSSVISLEEEVSRLRIYLDLEQFRMENKFEYSMEIDAGIEEDEIYIPTMIIQPFAENAVWHGVSALEGKGMIRIHFSLHSSKTLKIIIEDNGIGVKQSEKYAAKRENHLHLSMDMIRKRLEILGKKMKVETSMEISEAFPGNPNPGTRVEIVIPVSYESR